MSRTAVLGVALSATLATPATWSYALAAFLVRGGVVLILLPVIVVPTPAGLANLLAPLIAPAAFGTVPTTLIVLGLAAGAALVAWLLVGGWLAALMEAEAARLVVRDDDVAVMAVVADPGGIADDGHAPEPGRGREAARILAARLLALVPLMVVLGWGAVRLLTVAYRELTSPLDVATPVGLRVLGGAPEVVAAILVAWAVSEVVGGLAARRIVLCRESVPTAMRAAIRAAVRRPFAALAWFGLPLVVLLAVLVPSAVATGAAWTGLRDALAGPSALPAALAAVVWFVALWLIGLLLIAGVSAWRAAVWTVAVAVEPGTFGASHDRREGDWRSDPSSATL